MYKYIGMLKFLHIILHNHAIDTFIFSFGSSVAGPWFRVILIFENNNPMVFIQGPQYESINNLKKLDKRIFIRAISCDTGWQHQIYCWIKKV